MRRYVPAKEHVHICQIRSIELIQQPPVYFTWRICRISFPGKRVKEYLLNSRFCWTYSPAHIFFSLHYYSTEREGSFQVRLKWCMEEFTQTHTNGYMNYYYPQSKVQPIKNKIPNQVGPPTWTKLASTIFAFATSQEVILCMDFWALSVKKANTLCALLLAFAMWRK